MFTFSLWVLVIKFMQFIYFLLFSALHFLRKHLEFFEDSFRDFFSFRKIHFHSFLNEIVQFFPLNDILIVSNKVLIGLFFRTIVKILVEKWVPFKELIIINFTYIFLIKILKNSASVSVYFEQTVEKPFN